MYIQCMLSYTVWDTHHQLHLCRTRLTDVHLSRSVWSPTFVLVYPDLLVDKELHELIQSVDESGYFDKPSAQAEEEEEDLVGGVWG